MPVCCRQVNLCKVNKKIPYLFAITAICVNFVCGRHKSFPKNYRIMKFFRNILAAAVAALVLVSACDREQKFKVDGDIYGAEGKSVTLAKADFAGRWVVVDSARVDKNGHFSISAVSPASPEIYRLTYNNRFIYLPVDSVETIHVSTDTAKFGKDFKLTGTPKAELMEAFERDLRGYNPADSAASEAFKRSVYTKYIQDSRGSIISYYVLTKVVDGKPLYDPADPGDIRYYGAVATQFEQFRPDDPHGKMVREVSIKAMRKRNSDMGRRKVLQAEEKRVVDIALPDENGTVRKLSDYVGKGNRVLVAFGMMNDEKSPAFNRELAALQSKFGSGMTIYSVSVDADQYAWRDAARNLPWITVFDAGGMTSTALIDYNVSVLPSFYIYSADGELIDSAFTIEDLHKKLGL